MSTNKIIQLLCIIFVPTVVTTAVPISERQSASQILTATAVKGGLIIHLGCSDGKLTAALRAGDNFTVQGLDPDAKNVETARKHSIGDVHLRFGGGHHSVRLHNSSDARSVQASKSLTL